MHTFCQLPIWRWLFHFKVARCARGTLCHFPGDSSICLPLCFQKSSDPNKDSLSVTFALNFPVPQFFISLFSLLDTFSFEFVRPVIKAGSSFLPPHDILSVNDPGGVQLSEHIAIRCPYETKKSQATSLVDFNQMVLSSKRRENSNFDFLWVCRIKDLELY